MTLFQKLIQKKIPIDLTIMKKSLWVLSLVKPDPIIWRVDAKINYFLVIFFTYSGLTFPEGKINLGSFSFAPTNFFACNK